MTAALPVRVKLLHPKATLPSYATTGAACFDLHAVVDSTDGPIIVPADKAATINTGLAFELPHGYVLLINSRSGHGFKNSVRLGNSQGVLDADYRGKAMVRLHNDGATDFVVKHGDRVAQALVLPVPAVQLVPVDELNDTARGAGGLGSTGR